MKKSKKIISLSPAQTQQIGKETAKAILKEKLTRSKAFLIALEGDLGGGKTTFVQGFAKGLAIKEKITSPTFVILKKFKIAKFKYFYHIDCYRIKRPKEILDLDFQKIIADPKNIICLEWADKIKKILPAETIWLKFKFRNNKKREITFGNKLYFKKANKRVK